MREGDAVAGGFTGGLAAFGQPCRRADWGGALWVAVPRPTASSTVGLL